MTALPAETEVFRFPVTVRYMEVDGQGVVFNGWYLTYFDEAMAAFFAHRGLTYQSMQRDGYEVQTVRTEIDYLAGVRWGDPIVVAVSPSRLGRTSFALDYQVRRGEDAEVTTNGRIVYVVVDAAEHTKREIPPRLRAALGEPCPLH
jgi:acyl-CoA thioester hydrolase